MMIKLKSIKLKNLTFALIFAVILYIVVEKTWLEAKYPEEKDLVRLTIDKRIKYYSSSQECIHPNLPIDAPEIMKFMHDTPPINCSLGESDWVVCKNTECRLKSYIKARSRKIRCSFTKLERTNDSIVTIGNTTLTLHYTLEDSDVVEVACKSFNQSWYSILTGIRLDYDIWKRTDWKHVSENGLKLNVLMFGLHSVSRNTFIRKLPKSYKYLSEKLGALILEGYNIVGDGSAQSITPILTGKSEFELPDTRKRFKEAEFVDVYPFVWNDFRNSGYVTAYFEDAPIYGTYQFRLKGFKDSPTDHYMRPYYLAIESELDRWPALCVGSVPRHKIMLNNILDFFSVYKTKPKFLFGLHLELSYENYNSIGAIDDDFVEFLTNLEETSALEDTILIIMSDHGYRHGKIRESIQGKQEERMPFFSFRFPPWFKKSHKTIYDNFVVNTKRLTTPFDIYATLKSVLNLKNNVNSSRAISLFDVVPLERSCAQAYIEPQWCACLEWKSINLKQTIVERLSKTFVDTINNYTDSHRNLCSKLEVSNIVWVYNLRPNENLVKFQQSADIDDFHPVMLPKNVIEKETYHIRLSLIPGHALFEASIEHYLLDDKLVLKMNDIKIIKKNINYAKCIEYKFPHLLEYCYCLIN